MATPPLRKATDRTPPTGRLTVTNAIGITQAIASSAMTMPEEKVGRLSRRLHVLLEPASAGAYFAPETAAAYDAIGVPSASGYWYGRSAPFGVVPLEVVMATFAVWHPDVVAFSMGSGWNAGFTPADVMAARVKGAGGFVDRTLGGPPSERAVDLLRRAVGAIAPGGYPLFAALSSTPWPDDPSAALWLAADLLREQRGDAHIAAWRAAGLDPVEVHLLSALWSGQPFHLRAVFMGWKRPDIAGARQRLEDRNLIEGDPPAFTDAGRAVRAEIEAATDRQQRPALDTLGDDVDELFALLEPLYKTMASDTVESGSRTGTLAVNAGGAGALLPDPELLNPL